MFQNMPDFNQDTVCTSQGYRKDLEVFLFSNENVAGYLDNFDLSGKTVLTVGASGDHAFECYARGAKHVDTFDINYRQKPIIELKNHMIKNIPYEDFLEFFFTKDRFFDIQIIKPIMPLFSPSLRMFMDLYYSMGNAGRKMFAYNGQLDITAHYDNTYYSYEEKYNLLAKKLPRCISFKHLDITGLTANFTRKYDFIILSNIFDFQHSEIPDAYQALNQFYNGTLNDLAQNNLGPDGGTIILEYMWGNNSSTRDNMWDAWQEFATKKNTKTHATGHKMDNCFVKPMMGGRRYDNVLFMTQKQK